LMLGTLTHKCTPPSTGHFNYRIFFIDNTHLMYVGVSKSS
jgi:hypothetical protein